MEGLKAWDKELKQMFKVKSLDLSQWRVQCERPTDAPKENGGAFYGGRNSFKNEETDRHILLFPTGVKDINKKDVYLGDIIKEPVPTYGKLNEREKISFGIVKKEKNNNNMYVEWNYKSSYQGKTYWEWSKLGLDTIEVLELVGNILKDVDMVKKGE